MTSIDQYDYELPQELIAQQPAPRRDESRLMVVHRSEGRFEHYRFRDLPRLVSPADCLVLNDSRVVSARLIGRRVRTGGRWEGLFLRLCSEGRWELLAQTRGKPAPGEEIEIMPVRPEGRPQSDAAVAPTALRPAAALRLRLTEQNDEGIWLAEPVGTAPWWELLDRYGRVPLPPYIRRGLEGPEDRRRYQTVYARRPGSVAAPTAGLHFTEPLLDELRGQGTAVVPVTLHVGLGTFKPIASEQVESHRMHAEAGSVSAAAAECIFQRRAAGGKVVAVGTTTVRLLETAARRSPLPPRHGDAPAAFRFGGWEGWTDLYIHPPFEFLAVDAMLTNFHLPRSSLLVMATAFAGRELLRRAYAEAIRQRYRFYSYGDAMLVL